MRNPMDKNGLDKFSSSRNDRLEESQVLHTQAGAPVYDDQDTMTAGKRGPSMLQDVWLLEKLGNFHRENIPERIMHAKGSGAFGTFKVTNDITQYSKAKIFSEVGKETEMFARFSTVAGERGAADAERDIRGFALKFYTEEGNWDLAGNNTPVFFLRDPKRFADLNHAIKRDPRTNLRSPNTNWDFWTSLPESLFQLTITMSDRGIPSSYRYMHGFSSHTYSMINEENERVWVQFHFRSQQGIQNLTDQESAAVVAGDRESHQRDLYEAIEQGKYPKWKMYIQVMTQEEADNLDYNPFDLTKVWYKEDFPLIEVGEFELNENPENYFRDVEQATFNPNAFVPGIGPSPDRMLQARLFSYQDAARYRLGTNYWQIPVNYPRGVENFHPYHMNGQGRIYHNTDEIHTIPNSYGNFVDSPEKGGPAEMAISGAIGLVQEANEDAYKRFIQPAIEREIRSTLTEEAEDQAIKVFGENLRNLLLQAPLKGQKILGFDPAFRTGCKLAAVDETGKLLGVSVIYPHNPAPKTQRDAAGQELIDFIRKYDIDTIAIGNGTASRESEQFVADILKEMDEKVAYVIVNEAGASVYSASAEARNEFPDLQVEERSAVSIARRLQDPLAELVKIDPQSIGVGQYQHDVSQKKLTEQLDFVVETAVNQVGVNLNTASAVLLRHISGLTKTTAQNIIDFREENGLFTNRKQLNKVKRLGPKAYEQSAGFLRIVDGVEPFDNTGIHTESYKEAERVLDIAGIKKENLGSEEVREILGELNAKEVREAVGLGKETYQDIIKALTTPGRDMRDDMPAPLLRTDVLEIKDLTEGMELEGSVRNVIDFGAFVDIGVGQDGLVHISKLSNDYVKHPKDVVAVGDIVTVWIDSVDVKRGRIGLSMIKKK